MQKLIILSLVLLTTLSATLLTEIHGTTGNEKPLNKCAFEKGNTRLEKLKHFNVRNYLGTYRENKKEQNIRIDSIKRLEYLKSKERSLIIIKSDKKSAITQVQ